MKSIIHIAVKTQWQNGVQIKGIYFNDKKLMDKYPRSNQFFSITTKLFCISLHEINGDDLYIIKN